MKRTFILLMLAALGTALCAPAALAASSSIWIQSGVEAFYRGELENISLTSDGFMMLGVENKKILDSSEPYIWTTALDSRGNIYAGSGNKAILYKISPDGKTDQVAMLPGMGITALAVDGKDNVYAGTFPDGRITVFDPAGGSRELTNLPAEFIWAIRIDKDGNLIAATGAPASIYKVTPKGETASLMRSAERHILCIDVDEQGNIYAGSSPNGLVYKVEMPAKKLSVVYHAQEEEIYRLIYVGKGRLLAAANRDQMPSIPQQDSGAGPGGPQGPPQMQNPMNEPLSFPLPYNLPGLQLKPLPSAIYMVNIDGESRRLFTFPDPYILSLYKIDATHFIVGTGNRGNIYSINTETLDAALFQLPVKQILDVRSDANNSHRYYATANPGAVYTFSNNHNATGTYTSVVNDTFGPAIWGHISAEALAPDKTRIVYKTRAGNTSDPDDGTWSDWSPALVDLPAQVSSPPGRYLQFRASFFASDTNYTPMIKEIDIAYLNANQAPKIGDVSISQQSQKRQPPQPEPGASPQLPQRGPKNLMQPGGAPDAPPETNIQVGTLVANQEIAIKWLAVDPDGDTLRYSLYFRRLPSSQWSTLAADFFGSEFRWQTESVPDGKYEIKIAASDDPSNPAGSARRDYKISDPFIIDNSRPVLSGTITHTTKGAIKVTGAAADPTSIISGIEYSLDDLKWKTVFPDDLIFDSQAEKFTIELDGLAPGGHTIIVRARDFTGNTTSDSKTFTIE